MTLSQEMQEMVNAIKKYDTELRCNTTLYKPYFAPDIPEKVIKKLIKHFDSHLPINSVVAYYDNTLMGSAKTGSIFTNDGIYDRFIGKADYIRYADISDTCVSGNYLKIKTHTGDVNEYTIYGISENADTLKKLVDELIEIDKKFGQSSSKSTGKVKNMDIPEDMLKKCKVIIHGASTACGGVGTGLAQIPASDNAVIVPIQIAMITALGKVFDLDITEAGANGILGSAGASITGRTVSQFLVGWMPLIGNVINTATAAGVTETIGWIAVKHFYERWLDDKNKGRYEGKKEGYAEASGEYERKLKEQAYEFINQKKNIDREREEYEKLLEEYEKYIQKLERENKELKEQYVEIKIIYEMLKNLKDGSEKVNRRIGDSKAEEKKARTKKILEIRADNFLSGKINKEDSCEEYSKLLEDIEQALSDADDEELRQIQGKLANL